MSPRSTTRRRSTLAATLAGAVATSGLALGGAAVASTEPSGQIALVAYSTPKPAYQALISDFQQTKAGKSVTFTESFGPSGSQSRSVLAGLPADVVNFSLATDMERLVAKNIVSSSWNTGPTHGMVTDSVVVFVVPKGNPEHIKTWADLLKPGVRIFTPNPFSSGSARWNLMAAYGAEIKQGKTAAQATSYLQALLKNTVVQGTSAAEELTSFLQDEGQNKNDVFIDYEDDAIQAERNPQNPKTQYVIPPQTILIENPIAVTSVSKNAPAAQAFVNYLLSSAGQTEWAKLGYRPVLPSVEAKYRKVFPVPSGLFTIQSLGGWDQIATSFFGSKTGIVTTIEKNLGVSTSSS